MASTAAGDTAPSVAERSGAAPAPEVAPNPVHLAAAAPQYTEELSAEDAPLRSGAWGSEEMAYADKVAALFQAGSLPHFLTGATLRSLLADLTHCSPGRISKRFTGDRAFGKSGYRHTATDTSEAEVELKALELAFHEAVDGPTCLTTSLCGTSGLETPLEKKVRADAALRAKMQKEVEVAQRMGTTSYMSDYISGNNSSSIRSSGDGGNGGNGGNGGPSYHPAHEPPPHVSHFVAPLVMGPAGQHIQQLPPHQYTVVPPFAYQQPQHLHHLLGGGASFPGPMHGPAVPAAASGWSLGHEYLQHPPMYSQTPFPPYGCYSAPSMQEQPPQLSQPPYPQQHPPPQYSAPQGYYQQAPQYPQAAPHYTQGGYYYYPHPPSSHPSSPHAPYTGHHYQPGVHAGPYPLYHGQAPRAPFLLPPYHPVPMYGPRSIPNPEPFPVTTAYVAPTGSGLAPRPSSSESASTAVGGEEQGNEEASFDI